jgi:hypothetical protein
VTTTVCCAAGDEDCRCEEYEYGGGGCYEGGEGGACLRVAGGNEFTNNETRVVDIICNVYITFWGLGE